MTICDFFFTKILITKITIMFNINLNVFCILLLLLPFRQKEKTILLIRKSFYTFSWEVNLDIWGEEHKQVRCLIRRCFEKVEYRVGEPLGGIDSLLGLGEVYVVGLDTVVVNGLEQRNLVLGFVPTPVGGEVGRAVEDLLTLGTLVLNVNNHGTPKELSMDTCWVSLTFLSLDKI